MVKNMGAINYFTSDYITIGVNINDLYDDIESEFDDEYARDYYISDYINDLYDDIESALNDGKFYYFYVQLKPGYYEGFSIDIEFNFGYCLDSYRDKIDALKEVTRIKAFLLKCINNFGLCAVSPGWCTAYYDRAASLDKLNNAIKEMRATVQNTPTWAKVRRAGVNA
jgi:hypothetical protein